MDDQRLQLIRDYKATFSTDAGRRVLADLKARTPLNARAVPAGQPIDTSWLVYNEGQRAFVLDIMTKVEFDLEAPVQTSAITEEE